MYKVRSKMDVKDRLVLTGVRLTNFFIYSNFDLIFFTQTGRQESRQKARQTDRHMYRKTEYRKIKYRKTDVQTYMYIFVQTYIHI